MRYYTAGFLKNMLTFIENSQFEKFMEISEAIPIFI